MRVFEYFHFQMWTSAALMSHILHCATLAEFQRLSREVPCEDMVIQIFLETSQESVSPGSTLITTSKSHEP